MNFLGHTHVALASGHDDPVVLLGAVLPDLVSMARVTLDRGGLDGSLAAGVHCHVATDAVFHADPAFRAGAAAIRTAVDAQGLARGAARAVGHVGWELLLDGTLIGAPAEQAFWEALGVADAALPAIAPPQRERWLGFLSRWPGRRRPTQRYLHYDRPEWVAERLHQMLATRPRLGFRVEQLTLVAETLRLHAPAVAAVADEVLVRSVAGSVRRS